MGFQSVYFSSIRFDAPVGLEERCELPWGRWGSEAKPQWKVNLMHFTLTCDYRWYQFY